MASEEKSGGRKKDSKIIEKEMEKVKAREMGQVDEGGADRQGVMGRRKLQEGGILTS